MKKDKKVKKARKKYQNGGTSIKNYMQTPQDALAQLNINKASALADADGSFGVQATQLLSSLVSAMPSDSLSGMFKGGANSTSNSTSKSIEDYGGLPELAFGGSTGNVPVEVEKGEAVELPNSTLLKILGKTHEQGGEDMNLPEGSNVYSDRIKIDDVSMADRKTARHKKELTLGQFLEKFGSDGLIEKTSKRVKANNQREEEADMQLQEYISKIEENHKSQSNKKLEFGVEDLHLGDALGAVGNFMGANEARLSIENSRATDTPNVNHFADFGQDALDTLTDLEGKLDSEKYKNLIDLQRSKQSTMNRGRNSTRSVNTARALDLKSQQTHDRGEREVYSGHNKALMDILLKKASLENVQDEAVMSGAAAQDLANRKDKDVFNSQVGQANTDMWTALSNTGKTMNDISERGMTYDVLGSMYDMVEFDPETNTFRIKDDAYAKFRKEQEDVANIAAQGEQEDVTSIATQGVKQTKSTAINNEDFSSKQELLNYMNSDTKKNALIKKQKQSRGEKRRKEEDIERNKKDMKVLLNILRNQQRGY